MSDPQPEIQTHKRPDTLLADERFVRRAMSVVGLAVAVGLLLTVLILSVKVWLAVFAGILLAIFLRGLADFLSMATRLRPGWSLTVVVVVLLGLAALFGWRLVPQIAEQFQQLADQLPKAIQDVQSYFERLGWTRYLPKQAPTASEVAGNAAQIAAKAAGVFSVSVDAVSILMVIAFLALYLAASPEPYLNGLVALFPLTRRERVRHVLAELGATLRNWLLGQALSMLIVGILIAVGLKIIGIPLWLSLGLIASICDFIPVVGPLLSAIPAVLLAFTVSPWHPLYVIGLFVGVNTIFESHVVVPLIQRYIVSLPPGVAVVALVLMGKLFGFFGVLLAIPLAASLMVLIRLVYVQGVLGDSPTRPSEIPGSQKHKTDLLAENKGAVSP